MIKEQNYILTKLILWYTDSKVPAEKKQLLEQLVVDHLPQNEASNIMKTIVNSYIEEGFNKGITQDIEKGIEKEKTEGKAELIRMMINQGNSVDLVDQITDLSIDKSKNYI